MTTFLIDFKFPFKGEKLCKIIKKILPSDDGRHLPNPNRHKFVTKNNGRRTNEQVDDTLTNQASNLPANQPASQPDEQMITTVNSPLSVSDDGAWEISFH